MALNQQQRDAAVKEHLEWCDENGKLPCCGKCGSYMECNADKDENGEVVFEYPKAEYVKVDVEENGEVIYDVVCEYCAAEYERMWADAENEEMQE
jgi:hypothetical protein